MKTLQVPGWAMRLGVLLAIVRACAGVLGAPPDAGDGQAGPETHGLSDSARHVWLDYRRTAPFLDQGVAVSKDGRIVVVSEPPPGVEAVRIAELLGAERAETCHTTLGYDGWVADVVCELPPLPRRELDERLTELGIEMFGSAFGLEYTELPSAETSPVSQDGLNVLVGADDLHRWLFEEQRALLPVEGGDPSTAAALLSSGAEGVYATEEPGLVVLACRLGSTVESRARDWRRWLVDSDLVLGGACGESAALVVGRARQLGQAVFPPLRLEEVERLAAVDEDELAQSYERNHLLAGRWSGERFHDWAPIYLSAALLDSEYGSLLDITDQLLKSWSEVGRVEYVNFPYPKPAEYPFATRLSELIPGSSLTFNWNTSGVGHTLQLSPSLELYAVGRTGALPVSYIPSGMLDVVGADAADVAALEEQGYRAFALSGNVHLARVVQYAALYQMFRTFGVRSAVDVAVAIPEEGDRALRSILVGLLDRVRDMDDTEVESEAFRIAEASARVGDDDEAGFAQLLLGVHASLALDATKDLLDNGVAEHGDGYPGLVANFLAQPRPGGETWDRMSAALASLPRVGSDEEFERARQELAPEARELLDAFLLAQTFMDAEAPFRDVLAQMVDTERAMLDYAEAFQTARTPGWIRTPSIVQSEDTESVYAVGGHNIDSRIVRLVEDASVPRGAPRAVQEGGEIVVRVNPEDCAGSCQAVRRLAQSSDPAEEAARALEDARLEWNALPREPGGRLLSSGASPLEPPSGRVVLGGAYPESPAPGFTFPKNAGGRLAVVDASGRVSTNGRSFYRAETIRAKSDQLVGWIESKAPREGDTFVVNVAPEALSRGEADALEAQLGALLPRRIAVTLRYGEGSALESADLRRAVVGAVGSADGGRTFVIELTDQGRPLTVKARLHRSIGGAKERLERFFRELQEEADPVSVQQLKIQLEKIPELEDVRIQIKVPDEARSGIIITEKFEGGLRDDGELRAA